MSAERQTRQQEIDWALSHGPVPYDAALAAMQGRVRDIGDGSARELIWLLEHPPLYTAGTSTKADDLLDPGRFPVHWTGRGGELTYHGPGQRVVYVMLDLKRRFNGDVRAYVRALEEWIIDTLDGCGIRGETRPGRVGVWVRRGAGGEEAKIAAIGVRVRRGVSFHGLSINVAPELEHYSGIVACGLKGFAVTSLADLGSRATMKDVDISLRTHFESVFGRVAPVSSPVPGEDARPGAAVPHP
jgi:lipoyl(octanoyl) transferase